jgi:bifunctional non-homologous end joining protein LigD
MKRKLDRYAAKRTFTRTPEPGPKVASARHGPLLFVVQKHAARRLHYDFRLELDGVLKSWAVPKGPSLQVGEKRLAVEVEDHPFEYASFEGVIPEKQYGAGNVIVWDCGVYSPDEDGEYYFSDRREAEKRVRSELEQGKLSFFLRGEKLKGSFALVRTKQDKSWLLLKHSDRFADANDDVLTRNRSVVSGSTLDDLVPTRAWNSSDSARMVRESDGAEAARLAPVGPAEEIPKKLEPMLAELGDNPHTDPAWCYEPKLDGYRVIAFIDQGKVRLRSRRGIDLTAAFPEITADLELQAVERMVLDGEIVVLGADGRPSFNALQNRVQLKGAQEIANAQRESPAAMVCFDLLHFAGLNLRGAPYRDRRRYLAQCLLPTPNVQLVHVSDDGEQLYAAALESGFEGIVAKRKDSDYQPGRRSGSWVKFKVTSTAEFVVGGFTEGKGARESLGALLLGYWKGKELQYAGHVGSGLAEATVKQLRKELTERATKNSPFAGKPDLHRPTTWTKPELVAEVTFADWTPDGHLRAPVFVRLREDVKARDVRRKPTVAPTVRASGTQRAKRRAAKTPSDEVGAILQQLEGSAKQIDLIVGDAKIRLTNLDRVYWPTDKITKREYLRYLASVSRFMLPHLADRPLTMIRMPEGIDGERFFQKHWEQAKPDFVDTVTVYSDHKSEEHEYIVANNLPTLLWLGQVGTLEFHVWHSRSKVGPDAVSKSIDFSSSLEAMESSVLNYPDYLVFDIDPYIYSGKEAKGAEPELNKKGFAAGKRVAFWIRALLREMSLDGIIKTSGKTGLHLFVPIERTVTFDEARNICEMVGRHVMKDHPKDITMEWAVVKRTGKIFIDYNMNVRGKTLNVAYSPRGVPGAPVSMPLTWEELEAADPMDFTMRNVIPRLEKTGDRWQDALSVKQSLTKAFGS